MSPLCESWLAAEDLERMEPFYPLKAFVCERCWLVQLPAHVSGEAIFGRGDYAYFSSYSTSWLEHARRYVEMITARLGLGPQSQVVEVASNDGYLLQYFVERGIPALGIEPAENCAAAAREKGVATRCLFFGTQTARELRAGQRTGDRGQETKDSPAACPLSPDPYPLLSDGFLRRGADLLLGNNVLAHVPDLNDFVAGIKVLLADDGVNTMEFPHLLRLVEGNQFDTIYQEHYCYFSLLAIEQVYRRQGLTIFDVEELPTHGGSLRIYARHAENETRPVTAAVTGLLQREQAAGYDQLGVYQSFTEKVIEVKHRFLEFLIHARREGKQVAGYGAPGKAATLLNYCGVREDFIRYTVDRNPHKHGRYMAGVHIPVYPPEHLAQTRPDYIVILPWNLREEIATQLAYTRAWGAKLVVPIPRLEVF
jgi:hypothetical protein